MIGIALGSGEFDVSFDVTGDFVELFVGGKLVLDALAVTQDALRFFLIAPEIGAGYAFFERFQASAALPRVKDNSARG